MNIGGKCVRIVGIWVGISGMWVSIGRIWVTIGGIWVKYGWNGEFLMVSELIVKFGNRKLGKLGKF